MLWGYPPASKEFVSPIPQIVACNVWGVGPLSLGLLWGYPPAGWGFITCHLWLYGLALWGMHRPSLERGVQRRINTAGLGSRLEATIWGVCNAGVGEGGSYWGQQVHAAGPHCL